MNPVFKCHHPELELRPLSRGHAFEFFQLIDRNRAYLKQWLGWLDDMTSLDHLERYLQNALIEISDEHVMRAWVFKGEKIIGIVHLAEIDWTKRRAMIGYWIGQEYAGKGYATAAAAAMIDFAFEEWQLEEIEIRCASGNVASQKVAVKLGLDRTGLAFRNEWLYDRYVDHVIFTVRADAWRARARSSSEDPKASPSGRT